MPRKSITVAEVGEIRTFGDTGKSLPVKGTDGVRYQCFRPQLFEHIVVGADIDCEVEEKTSKDGQYVNHNIMGIFKDGQPVGQRQGGGQGGGRPYGKSPETVQFERASIEFNNAMSETGQRVSEGKAPPDIENAYWGHLRRLLRVGLQEAYDATTQAIIATAKHAASIQPIPTGYPQPRTSRDAAAELDRNFAGTVGKATGATSSNTQALLALGAQLGYPGGVFFKAGNSIGAGQEGWERFAGAAGDAELRAAIASAKARLEGADDGPF